MSPEEQQNKNKIRLLSPINNKDALNEYNSSKQVSSESAANNKPIIMRKVISNDQQDEINTDQQI